MFRKIAAFAACLFVASLANAQMEAAQKVHLDIDTGVVYKTSVIALWDAIKDPAAWAAFSNGFVQSIEVTGEKENQKRTIQFTDGTQRKDMVTQYQPEYKMIVFKMSEPMEPSVKDCTLMFVIRTPEESCTAEFHIGVIMQGNKADKEKMLPHLRKEMASYLQGMSNRFSK
ncbi:hypothetical protein HHL16_11110 [Pseudoflavitalea sp. G-6-1-2]|uniref:hypothetical protein n=1 Tax=Pseudoflavitalea sp. G-6-1-2 TaxID=2728841 RepID=UPI00146A31DC|nr:hypothetical protein [Pseudoflavitalea sp. G-6-1-2]NML21427.1 hypothetical protein [Pseudoflavitalea sp. G-6-1-2]